jgi:hypothetical protein
MPATQLFDIVNVSKLKLKVNVNESQVAGLKGSTTNVVASKPIDPVPVEIEITNNASKDLKAGMYGTATLF